MYEPNPGYYLFKGVEHVDIINSEQTACAVSRIKLEQALGVDSKRLTSLTFHQGVEIGETAFAHCKGLTSVVIHPGVTIGEWAFLGCTGLKSVVIHQGATIGKSAFKKHVKPVDE